MKDLSAFYYDKKLNQIVIVEFFEVSTWSNRQIYILTSGNSYLDNYFCFQHTLDATIKKKQMIKIGGLDL